MVEFSGVLRQDLLALPKGPARHDPASAPGSAGIQLISAVVQVPI
jgi:hypothetical protein